MTIKECDHSDSPVRCMRSLPLSLPGAGLSQLSCPLQSEGKPRPELSSPSELVSASPLDI